MRIFLNIFFILIIFKPCFSETGRLRFKQIDASHGLSQAEVKSIYQDKAGFIWIGTIHGIYKYDGYNMLTYQTLPDNPNSLSDNYIKVFWEDKNFRLYIGTFNGLNRYNNETDNFTRYLNVEVNSKDRRTDITQIIQKRSGEILIGTNLGLYIYPEGIISRDSSSYSRYFQRTVNNFIEDQDGYLWLATWEGVYKISLNKKGVPQIISHFQHNTQNPNGISSNDVNCIFQEKSGNLWIGTNFGLNIISKEDLNKENPKFNKDIFGSNSILYKSGISCIHEDRFGRLFVGTQRNGLCVIEKDRKTYSTYQVEENNNFSISSNLISKIYEDKNGIIWIGTDGGGCNKVEFSQKEFINYRIKLDNKNVYSNYIRSLYEDNDGTLWIGTLGDGLYTYNVLSKKYSKFPGIHQQIVDNKLIYNTNAIYGNNVFSISEFEKDQLWVATNGGINIINKKSGKVKHHLSDYSNPDSLKSNTVFSIAKDDDGSYWIGTWEALHRYNPTSKTDKICFKRYTYDVNDSNSISYNVTNYIYNDPKNSDVWVATMSRGLNRIVKLDNNEVKFIRYEYDEKKSNSLSNNNVSTILRTSDGKLWVATEDGLNQFIPGKGLYEGSFIRYNKENGLEGNVVQSMLEDKQGNLWLATNMGISKFNPQSEKFINFDIKDELLNNVFSNRSFFKNKEGKMYFGGIKGFTSFYPENIEANKHIPTAVFTRLLLADKEIVAGDTINGKVILQKPLWETKEIELSYKHNLIVIEFSALHFNSPQSNKYAYKIEGIHNDWIYTDYKNRRVSFTNLAGGTYILKIKASNNDGLWQTNPTSLTIKINNPIWLSWPAIILYIIIVYLIVYFIVKEFKSKEKLRTEVALKNLEMKKADELNDLKLQFFTNISHEFRTPLTLIITPLNSILDIWKGENSIKEKLTTMYRNSVYLLNLTNELLDFQKSGSGYFKLKASKNNVIEYTSEIYSNFKEVTEQKGIQLEFVKNMNETEVWFDKGLMYKVINNLLFNAYKFTTQGGKISIVLEKGEKNSWQCNFAHSLSIGESNYSGINEYVFIKVIDNGIGISSESIQKIFDRFYQVGSSDSKDHLGSGIGLALAKNLVLLNKGIIVVSSERNKGTEFIVCLPLGDTHLNDNEKLFAQPSESQSSIELNSPSNYTKSVEYDNENEGLSSDAEVAEKEIILLVEDNLELRNYIKNSLINKYEIIEAENGVEGLEIATDIMPNLIISDVMMPEMNGIDLCAELKQNMITSHIPVILLTALSSVKDQIIGLETGADDYISKPFNMTLLEVRIQNLLLSRKKLREQFGKNAEINTIEISANSKDQEFLEHLIQIIKNKISEPELNVSEISNDLLMSRMHIYRKIKALSGQSPSEFIRTIKLKEAASLLNESKYTISEISFKVGFTSPTYFTKSFKKLFGITPSEYITKKNL